MILSESEKTKVELRNSGGDVVVTITGVIDEDVNLGLVLSALSGASPAPSRLVFDLGKVRRINSCGVREWILLLKKIPDSIKCTFDNLSIELVEQANPIPDVVGRGKGIVRSFEAPYFCEKCHKTMQCMLQPAQVTLSGNKPVPPEQQCKTCSSPLTFDGLPEEYFHFLRWSGHG